MFYKIFNLFLERKINKIRPIIRRYLERDLNNWQNTLSKIHTGQDDVVKDIYNGNSEEIEKNIENIREEQIVEKEYVFLIDYWKGDSKRRYMINSNFYKYLKATLYLKETSILNIQAGIFTAPAEIYYARDMVKKSFKELITALDIKI